MKIADRTGERASGGPLLKRLVSLLSLCCLMLLMSCNGNGTGTGSTDTNGTSIVYHVANTGNDANPGTEGQPFKSIARARDVLRTQTKTMAGDIFVMIHDGWYFQSSTLAFDERDSGQNGFTVSYVAAPNASPVISGGQLIKNWTLSDAAAGIWSAPAPGLSTRQLIVNNQRAVRARSSVNPIVGATKTSLGYSTSAPLSAFRRPQDLEFIYNSLAGGQSGTATWLEQRVGVSTISVDSNNQTIIIMKQPAWSNASMYSWTAVGLPTSAENAYELLDEPGEWYLDQGIGRIYYIPKSGENMTTAVVIAPALETLVACTGSLDNPIHHLRFQGITFAHATWMRPSTGNGFPEAQANQLVDGAYTPGNVLVQRAHDMHFERCMFTHLGGAGLEMSGGVQFSEVLGCRFTDISGAAIVHGTVADPDRGVIADREDSNTFLECYIENIANEYHGACAIFNGYVSNALITHNEIVDAPYTGISIGWGWGTNSYASRNRVLNNYVRGFTEKLSDGGGFYALSAQPNSELSGNVFQHQVNDGAAIFPDEGSSGWNIHGNVCDDISRWLLIWTGSINNINIQNNFTTTANFSNKGTDITLINNQAAPRTLWSADTWTIMNNAGLTPAWADVKSLPDGSASFAP